MTVETPKKDANLATQIAALKTLRDELRVQAHLGGMEAKDAWNKIEPAFDSLVQEATSVGYITVHAMTGVFKELKHFVSAVQHEERIQHDKRQARS